MAARLELAGVEQHHPAADHREGVLQLEIVEDGTLGDDVFEQRPQVGDVPLAVAQLVNEAVLGLFGGDVKGLIESAVGGADAQGGVEDQQRLAHRIDDVQGVVLNILDQWLRFHPQQPPVCLSPAQTIPSSPSARLRAFPFRIVVERKNLLDAFGSAVALVVQHFERLADARQPRIVLQLGAAGAAINAVEDGGEIEQAAACFEEIRIQSGAGRRGG